MIFQHPDNIQRSDCDRLVLATQSRRQLMQEIEPNTGNSFVNSRQFDALFLASGFDFLGQLLKRTGIFDNIAVAVGAECLYICSR